MKYSVRISARFRKDMKLVQKRGYDQRLIFEVIELLANGMKLDEKYKDHLLTGDYGGFRECHITPDWLLVYQYREQELLLLLSRTGTHSSLFLMMEQAAMTYKGLEEEFQKAVDDYLTFCSETGKRPEMPNA